MPPIWDVGVHYLSTIAPEQVNIGTGWRHEGAHAQVDGKISGLTEMELEIIGAWAAAALAAF